MKIKSGFVLRNVADNWIVVPTGERVIDLNGLITLSESGALLWKYLQDEVEKKDLVDALLEEYEVSEEEAIQDVEAFLADLVAGSILET